MMNNVLKFELKQSSAPQGTTYKSSSVVADMEEERIYKMCRDVEAFMDEMGIEDDVEASFMLDPVKDYL